jgi:RimJ/RimL family protein N-acetyltransferase
MLDAYVPRTSPPAPYFRKLRPFERGAYLGHLRGLSVDDRRLRFHAITSDEQLEHHAAGIDFACTIILGAFVEGVLVGVGEVSFMHPPRETRPEEAEIAVSVASAVRGRGIGGALTGRALRIARNRGARAVWMFCLPDNTPMQKIARSLDGQLTLHQGTFDARMELTRATTLTRIGETFEDGVGVARSVSVLVFTSCQPPVLTP